MNTPILERKRKRITLPILGIFHMNKLDLTFLPKCSTFFIDRFKSIFHFFTLEEAVRFCSLKKLQPQEVDALPQERTMEHYQDLLEFFRSQRSCQASVNPCYFEIHSKRYRRERGKKHHLHLRTQT